MNFGDAATNGSLSKCSHFNLASSGSDLVPSYLEELEGQGLKAAESRAQKSSGFCWQTHSTFLLERIETLFYFSQLNLLTSHFLRVLRVIGHMLGGHQPEFNGRAGSGS